MRAASGAVGAMDRRRMRTSILVSVVLWGLFLPLLSLMRYEGPVSEPSMNPMFIELEPPAPPPEQAPPPAVERVEMAANTARAAPSSAPVARAAPSPAEQAAATPALRPDPSAEPTARRRTPAAAAGGADALPALSEDALRNAAPAAPTTGTPPPAAAGAVDRSAAPVPARADAFDRSQREVAERLAAAPAQPGPAASSGSAAQAPRADMDGGFDFGDGAKRELLSPRRIRVPDRLLAGLPAVVSTNVSLKIEAGGTVYRGSIRFDPPLPEDLAAYLRVAFSAWQFSFSDSDGQVVFRYSITVR